MFTSVKCSDGKYRCSWCNQTPEYLHYHDTEWGFPQASDQSLFEKICLEGFQSGLSWRTILAKRQDFRRVFNNFELEKVARFQAHDIERLLQDASIIRHRGKIEATINNARRAQELIAEEGSLARYIWRYEPTNAQALRPLMATSPESIALSKDLKKRGWKFVGPTTLYAFMQSLGLVNDHAQDCVIRAQVKAARSRFELPT